VPNKNQQLTFFSSLLVVLNSTTGLLQKFSCAWRYVKGRILRNILALILLPIIISGCASIRIIESIGESGGCELVSHVSAQGNSEEQVKSRLERKVVKLNGNLLLYNANSGLEVTLHNSKNSLEGVGSAYKCADL